MFKSITYLEIRCKYNKSDLLNFSGVLSDENARRLFTYRNHEYFLKYVTSVDKFYLFNKHYACVAVIDEDSFGFFPADAPEISLNLIWGLLAILNIYPVKCF